MQPSREPHASGSTPARDGLAVLAILMALVAQLLATPVAAAAEPSPQSISFSLPASGLVGTSVALDATADSGIAVEFESYTTDVCTVAETTLTLVAAGTCTVMASQEGDGTWAPAPDVEASMTVGLSPQTITFSLPASGFIGTAVSLGAAADSGLPVAYAVDTPDVCTSDGTTLGLVAAGTCTVTASQDGDGTWAPAPEVEASVTVDAPPPELSPQAITFSLPASGFAGSTISLSATSDSGLVVAFASETAEVCTVQVTTLSLVAAGTCRVTASQAGDDTWAPAQDVSASVIVELVPQAITFSLPASGFAGSKVRLTATAESGLGVSYTSTTLGTCTVTGALLALNAAGACIVTASQAGNLEWAAASEVQASMAVEPVPAGVDLGKYAVNGTVHAVVTDAATGRTYLGGDFTEIGLRTGPVAVVNPPDQGAGDLLASSPEVLGTVKAVFADDRPGDPGFFIVGELLAVNGEPVPAVPVTRMHLNPTGAKWVVDASWTATNEDACVAFGRANTWIATPDLLIAGMYTYAWNPTGLWTVDRRTGECSISLASVPSALPPLAGCSALMYCFGSVDHLAWDEESNRLFASYQTFVGADSNTTAYRGFIAAYDLSAAHDGRIWVTGLQSDPPPGVTNWTGTASGLGMSAGAVLVQGTFPFDASDSELRNASRFLAVDAETGATLERWNSTGNQNLADGLPAGPASPCFTSTRGGPLFDLDGTTSRWVQDWSWTDYALCQYSTRDGAVAGTRIGDYSVPATDASSLPTVVYRANGEATFLVGPDSALELSSGTLSRWHPDAATAPNTPQVSIAITSAGIIVAGDFTFVRGASSPGVVALTSSLSPDPGFVSPLSASPSADVRALAVDDGWLLAGGTFFFPTDPGADWDLRSIIALDPSSGDLVNWSPSVPPPGVVDTIAVNPASGEFWIGGSSRGLWGATATSLLHFARPTSGAGALTAPSLTCLEAGGAYTMDTPVCQPAGNDTTEVRALSFDAAGRLYVAGAFGSVDGHAHRGLARLDAAGSVDAWDADLLGVVPIPDGSYLWQLVPHSIAVLDNRLLVGGTFCSMEPKEGGGAAGTCHSPLLVFSTESGALLRPTDPAVSPWFPVFGWWSAGYSILASGTGVVVALGDVGVAVFDPVTLDFDSAASLPFLSTNWWAHDYRNGVFALAVPQTPPGNSGATTRRLLVALDGLSPRVIFAGSMSRWGDHVAGNMASATITATPDYTLTISRIGSGTGTVTSGAGEIDCGSTCATDLASGSSIELTAHPAAGSSFSGWTGGGCSGSAPCTVSISGPTTVTATFVTTPVDPIAPTATAPTAALRTGVPLSGTSIPIHLAWSGADTGGSGVDHYELARSTNGGANWTVIVSSQPSAAADVTVASSGTVRFRVRAVDGAGNPSAWATGPNLTLRLIQQSGTTVHYRGAWRSTSSSLMSGGSAKYTKSAGASATYTFTGRSMALVATTASTRGKVKVYVKGKLVSTVDLRSSSTKYRVVVWQKTWTTSATRNVKLVVVGTSGRPRVDLDAFVALK